MKPPSNLPALPEGFVYLGPGGSFKTDGNLFSALCAWSSGREWYTEVDVAGASHNLLYAVREGSRMALLNAEELDDSALPPSSPPRGWVRLSSTDKIQRHDLLDLAGLTWAKGCIGMLVASTPAYRHPGRHTQPPALPPPAWRDYSSAFTPAERLRFIADVAEAADRGDRLEVANLACDSWKILGDWRLIDHCSADHVARFFTKGSFAYRVAPVVSAPKTALWNFSTAPKGCVLVRQGPDHCQLVLGWGTHGVALSSSNASYTNEPSYKKLLDEYEHSLDGGKTWHPCGVSA